MGHIPPPKALGGEEFERRTFPGAALRDVDPAFCAWVEETSPFWRTRCFLAWLFRRPRPKLARLDEPLGGGGYAEKA
jgi:hypothetical protein